MNPAEIVIQSDRLQMVRGEKFAFVRVRLHMMLTAQAYGAKSSVVYAFPVSSVCTDSVHVMHFSRHITHGAFGMLDAVVHVSPGVIRSA